MQSASGSSLKTAWGNPSCLKAHGLCRRKGTDEEIAMWQNHVKMAQRTKGYDLLWKNMRTVRDIYFEGASNDNNLSLSLPIGSG
jgi:hypothetical protein